MRKELEEKWGSQLFDLADFQIKAFSAEVISLMQKENKLASDYSKLVASAQVEFNGETLTLAQLGPYGESTDAISWFLVHNRFKHYLKTWNINNILEIVCY